MVLKKGSLMTSGHTAGQGLPHIRLKDKIIICLSRMERCVNAWSDTDFLHNNHNDCWQHPENRLGMFKFAFAKPYFHTSFTYTNIMREDGKWEVQWDICFFFHFFSRERSVQTAYAQLITTFTLPLTKAVMTKQARPVTQNTSYGCEALWSTESISGEKWVMLSVFVLDNQTHFCFFVSGLDWGTIMEN